VPEIGDIRITRSADALYLISLTKPTSVSLRAPLPILPTDKVYLLKAGGDTPIPFTVGDETVFDLSG
jgi:hypothetical protein